MGKKGLVIFGCRKISVDVISHILGKYQDQCDIKLVVTQDEERDLVYGDIFVSDFCNKVGIPNVRFNGVVDASIIKQCAPDLLFSFYYRRLIKKDVLSVPTMGCINVHPALLPQGRGPAPSLWNVLDGDQYAGCTLHYMIEDVDAGDIIDQTKVEVGEMTGFELNVRLMNEGFDLFRRNFDDILDGKNNRHTQDESKAKYCLPYIDNMRYLYWDSPDRVINQVRAFTKPFLGALTTHKRSAIVKVWRVERAGKRNSLKIPGCFEACDRGLLVQTCTDPVLVTDFEVDGILPSKGRFDIGLVIEKGLT
jgi:methionyl-tRNA formyltransferase